MGGQACLGAAVSRRTSGALCRSIRSRGVGVWGCTAPRVVAGYCLRRTPPPSVSEAEKKGFVFLKSASHFHQTTPRPPRVVKQ